VGLAETAFWDMTKAEIERYMEGAVWRYKTQAQFDYNLANLFGIAVARILDSNVSYPAIEEVYPNLFDKEIQNKKISEEEERMTNSTNNFLAFAKAHNARIRKEVNEE
jgi:hypothetical protein